MKTRILATFLALLPMTIGIGTAQPRELGFEERVDAERAIQRVYYLHQIGAEEPFDVAVPIQATEARVREILKRSAALEKFWSTPVTAELLDAEISRIATETRLPDRLEEVYDALGHDPFLIRETLARSTLVERLTRSFFLQDARIHADSRRRAEELRQQLSGAPAGVLPEQDGLTIVELSPRTAGEEPDRGEAGRGPDGHRQIRRSVVAAELGRWRETLATRAGEIGPVRDVGDLYVVRKLLSSDGEKLRFASYAVPKRTWEDWWSDVQDDLDSSSVRAVATDEELPGPGGASGLSLSAGSNAALPVPDDTWENGILDDLPDARVGHTAVWTGNKMIVWGGLNGTVLGSGDLYDPLTDLWVSTSSHGAPAGRQAHTAVWTGTKMIVWGGMDGAGALDSGGVYDPIADSWTATSTQDAPSARGSHSAVWDGSRMVIWGGSDGAASLDTGGVYDPGMNSWTATSVSNAPQARSDHTAVWTGNRMVVWGGVDSMGGTLATGGRYDTATDSWSATSASGTPAARTAHTAIWSGSVMVIWGGADAGGNALGSGGRYDPNTDVWASTTNGGAPEARSHHTAVWSGSRMILWGGTDAFGDPLGTGSRYDPVGNNWSSTTSSNAPDARADHSAVWTGSLMIVWGGTGPLGGSIDTGGRYNPTNNSWTPTAMGSGPTARAFHTAVWTGSQMIVWGGSMDTTYLATGARYDPMIDSWSATSGTSAPSARDSHTAVWTGSQMIVWGGGDASGFLGTGGRYNPVSNSWTAMQTTGAPSARAFHTAVWTGSEMVVWGGDGATGRLSSGGRYDPVANAWTDTQTVGVPEARRFHTAVWTGSEMIVWGGQGSSGRLATGGRYNPLSDSWLDTTTAVVPRRRTDHSAVWTGSRMIIWGGFSPGPENSGGIYDPVANSWTATTTAGSPQARGLHVAEWSGNRMVIWGGSSDSVQYGTGGRYNPIADSWEPVSMADSPIGRDFSRAVWTGDSMIVWGGLAVDPLNSGGQYGAVSPDTDGDGVNDGDDCAPLDFTVSGPPEVDITDVTGVMPTTITYALQQGGSSANYQIVSGLLTRLQSAMSFQEGFCLVDSTSGGTYDDARPSPPPGDGWYYLMRGENVCGTGSFGSTLADEPGAGDVCENGILDEDIDGIRSDIDCNDLDPSAQFPLEEESQNMLVSQDGTIFAWGPVQPVDSSTILYQLVRGNVGELPVGSGASEVCIEQGVTYTVAVDFEEPPPGEAFWYLSRAKNGCGPATYGFRTDGTENVSSACP